MNWILILTMMAGNNSNSSITAIDRPFITKEACETAGVLWEDKAHTKSSGKYAFYLCVEQGR